jgi:hypothetical protein
LFQPFTAPCRQVSPRRAARLVGRVAERPRPPGVGTRSRTEGADPVRRLAGAPTVLDNDISGGRIPSHRRSAETVQCQSAQHAPSRHARSPRVGMRLHPHQPRVSVRVWCIIARAEPSPCLLPTAVSPMRPQVEVGGGGGQRDAPAPRARASRARHEHGERVRRRRQHQVCAARRVRASPSVCCVLTACVHITGLRNDVAVEHRPPRLSRQRPRLVGGADEAHAARRGQGGRRSRPSGSARGSPPAAAVGSRTGRGRCAGAQERQ